MCRRNQYRRLLACTLPATFFAFSFAAFGQAPASQTTPAPQATHPSAVTHPPPTPEELGDSLMVHRRYQAAIAAYKKAPRNSASAWNKMGIAYQMMFDLDDAMDCYKKSLKLDRKNANVLNNLGTVYDSQKDYRSSEKMYRKALKANPKSAIVLKNLGTSLMAQRKYKKGWAAYQAALKIDPNVFVSTSGPKVQNPVSIKERGAMNYYMAKGCLRAGYKERAIEYLSKALNEGFTNPKKIAADEEFAALRGIPSFERLIAEQSNHQ